jgi:hypothetical protein
MDYHFLLKTARHIFSQWLTTDPSRPRGSEKEKWHRKANFVGRNPPQRLLE